MIENHELHSACLCRPSFESSCELSVSMIQLVLSFLFLSFSKGFETKRLQIMNYILLAYVALLFNPIRPGGGGGGGLRGPDDQTNNGVSYVRLITYIIFGSTGSLLNMAEIIWISKRKSKFELVLLSLGWADILIGLTFQFYGTGYEPFLSDQKSNGKHVVQIKAITLSVTDCLHA